MVPHREWFSHAVWDSVWSEERRGEGRENYEWGREKEVCVSVCVYVRCVCVFVCVHYVHVCLCVCELWNRELVIMRVVLWYCRMMMVPRLRKKRRTRKRTEMRIKWVSDCAHLCCILTHCCMRWLDCMHVFCFILSPDVILCGWLGLKYQLTN